MVPPRCRVWNGYVLPEHGRTFRRDELIDLAAANGQQLSPALLHKWRQWRMLPGPTPGGATGKGRGKGQTWPEGAGWRVAWISRWLSDSLTYDALRFALWPWTPELERDRPGQLIASLARFLVQDRQYHEVMWETLPDHVREELDPYLWLMDGDARPEIVRAALKGAGIGPTHPGAEPHARFVAHLSFDALSGTAARVTEAALRDFITAFRSGFSEPEKLITIFWDSPLGLSRIVIRELYRHRLRKAGTI